MDNDGIYVVEVQSCKKTRLKKICKICYSFLNNLASLSFSTANHIVCSVLNGKIIVETSAACHKESDGIHFVISMDSHSHLPQVRREFNCPFQVQTGETGIIPEATSN